MIDKLAAMRDNFVVNYRNGISDNILIFEGGDIILLSEKLMELLEGIQSRLQTNNLMPVFEAAGNRAFSRSRCDSCDNRCDGRCEDNCSGDCEAPCGNSCNYDNA